MSIWTQERELTLLMIGTCMLRQTGDLAFPSMGTPPADPDPVNHETLPATADPGIEGHVTDTMGSEDARVTVAHPEAYA